MKWTYSATVLKHQLNFGFLHFTPKVSLIILELLGLTVFNVMFNC